MQKGKMMGKEPLHTEFFYAGKRCCFIDLRPTVNDQLCISIAVGVDRGNHTSYRRLILFEHELPYFAEALRGVISEYMAIDKGDSPAMTEYSYP